MKKVLALMIGCAVSGTLVAGSQNPVTQTVVTNMLAAQKTAITQTINKTANSASPLGVGPNYGNVSNCGFPPMLPPGLPQTCLIFTSYTTLNGKGEADPDSNPYNLTPADLGTGPGSAEQVCQTESQVRFGSGNYDWFFAFIASNYIQITPYATYVNTSRQELGKSKAMFNDKSTTVQRLMNSVNTFKKYVWTGYTTWPKSSASTCKGWTSSDAADFGTIGNSGSVEATWLTNGKASCAEYYSVLCIEMASPGPPASP